MHSPAKRIGLVLSQAPGYSETFLVNKVKGLIASGYDVVLFTSKKSGRSFCYCREVVAYQIAEGVVSRFLSVVVVLLTTTIRSPFRVWRFYRLERARGVSLSKLIRRLSISAHILPYTLDYLHFGFATLGVDRENIGRVVGAKVSASFRGYDVSIFPLTRPNVYSKLWQSLDKIHTISNDLYLQAVHQGLPVTIPCVKITPAIDVNKFLYERDLGRTANVLRILTIARMQWKKGLEVALEAMALLQGRGVEFQYTIVGSGIDYDRLCFARHQLNLEEKVIFAGRRTPAEIVDLMKAHDMYIQPSVQEGFCNAVLEAQASGLLCIVTNAEGLSENVLNEVTGWVVPKYDSVALANKIDEVRQLPSTQKEKVANDAVARVLSEFGLEKQAAFFSEFFNY